MWGSLKDEVYETHCHTLGEPRNNIRSQNSTVPPESLQRVNNKVSRKYLKYIRRTRAKHSETSHKKQIRRSVELLFIDPVGNNTLVVLAVTAEVVVVVVVVAAAAVEVVVVVVAVVVV